MLKKIVTKIIHYHYQTTGVLIYAHLIRHHFHRLRYPEPVQDLYPNFRFAGFNTYLVLLILTFFLC